MFVRTVQALVSAQRASPFPTRQLHSLRGSSTHHDPLFRGRISSHKCEPPQEDPSTPFNVWAQIREARPAVRCTVYAGLGLMATAETTFWFNVIKAKYFPTASVEAQEKAEDFLEELRAVIKDYRAVWLRNYKRYYSGYIWGAGYGGLDGFDS